MNKKRKVKHETEHKGACGAAGKIPVIRIRERKTGRSQFGIPSGTS